MVLVMIMAYTFQKSERMDYSYYPLCGQHHPVYRCPNAAGNAIMDTCLGCPREKETPSLKKTSCIINPK